MSIDDDYDFLYEDDITEEEDEKKKDKPSRIVPLTILFAVIMAIVGAVVFGGNSSEEAQQTPEEKPVVEKQELQLVNLQQVEWSRDMCVLVNKWGEKMVDMKSSEKPLSSREARKRMIRNITYNTRQINNFADSMLNIPEKSMSSAKDRESQTLVTDNNLIVGDAVDPTVDSASRGMSSAFAGYASSLQNISSQLDSIADYDANGIRSGMAESQKSIEQLNAQLTDDITKTIGEDFYDNVATMRVVADIPECSGSFINMDTLQELKKDELKKQEMVSNYAVSKRCRQYIDNNSTNTSSTVVEDNVTACQDFLAENTVNMDDPLFAEGVDTKDNQRAEPGNVSEEKSETQDSETQGSSSSKEKTNTDMKKSSSSSATSTSKEKNN